MWCLKNMSVCNASHKICPPCTRSTCKLLLRLQAKIPAFTIPNYIPKRLMSAFWIPHVQEICPPLPHHPSLTSPRHSSALSTHSCMQNFIPEHEPQTAGVPYSAGAPLGSGCAMLSWIRVTAPSTNVLDSGVSCRPRSLAALLLSMRSFTSYS